MAPLRHCQFSSQFQLGNPPLHIMYPYRGVALKKALDTACPPRVSRLDPTTPECYGGTALVKRKGSRPPKVTRSGGWAIVPSVAGRRLHIMWARRDASRDSLPATAAFHPVLHPSDPMLIPQSRWRV